MSIQLFSSGPVRVSRFALRSFAAFSLAILFSAAAAAQDGSSAPVVVRPGAPGQPTKILPASTRAKLPPSSRKDVEFMQGMIMHHAQAVEMTALIEERTKNKDLHLLGERISKSQADEMNFMKRWLQLRGESTVHEMPDSHSHDAHGTSQEMLMPGMLTKAQMDALKKGERGRVRPAFPGRDDPTPQRCTYNGG